MLDFIFTFVIFEKGTNFSLAVFQSQIAFLEANNNQITFFSHARQHLSQGKRVLVHIECDDLDGSCRTRKGTLA